jgi:GNAT superfamily N-acetyltransferase
MRSVEFRRWRSTDSIPDLTKLLHRAYGPLAEMGMRFLASHQDDATTLERVSGGECWVGVMGDRVIATVTVRRPLAVAHESPWYARPDVASMEQLAVDPEHQRNGVGSALIALAERVATEWGYAEMALDTSERAEHLLRIYQKRGYRIVETLERDIVNYRSIVLSKRLRE